MGGDKGSQKRIGLNIRNLLMTERKKYADYQDWLLEELQDPQLALAYLNKALTDKDPRVFLVALKDVLEARGGDISTLAQEARLSRQNIYRMLSKRGNPRWNSLTSLFDTMGLQVHLSSKNRV
jgi:probable addiction module antidote protein